MKYILKRGQKKQAFVGTRVKTVNGAVITTMEDVVMEPGKVVDTDLDLSAWSAMIDVFPEPKSEAKKVPVVEPPVSVPTGEPEVPNEMETEKPEVVEEDIPDEDDTVSLKPEPGHKKDKGSPKAKKKNR